MAQEPIRNRRVTFQAKSSARDKLGHSDTYVDVKKAWASVEGVTGKEFEADGAFIAGEVTYRVRCNYQPGITADMRIVHNGKTLEILAVIDVNEAHRDLEIACREVK